MPLLARQYLHNLKFMPYALFRRQGYSLRWRRSCGMLFPDLSPIMSSGLVLSDLHLFSIRSSGECHLISIRERLEQADHIVFNGDTFDFRWSQYPTEEQSVAAALDWLRDFVDRHPRSTVHFVIGNHDCLHAFTSRLDDLADNLERFHWHDTVLQLGPNLFTHGDCTHQLMDRHGLNRYREVWKNDRPRHPLLGRAYLVADRLGLTTLAHRGHFTREKTLERLSAFLDDSVPDWRPITRDCYFGHTHLSFHDHVHEGRRYHNTGSAIKGSTFAPKAFEWGR